MIYDRFLNCGRKKIETIENNLLTLPFSCMKLELFSLMKNWRMKFRQQKCKSTERTMHLLTEI